MVLGVPDEEDVSRGLGFVVVQPGGQFFFPRLQVPLPQVHQGQRFSPNVETGEVWSLCPLSTSQPGDFWQDSLCVLGKHRDKPMSSALRHCPESPVPRSTSHLLHRAECQACSG